MKKKRWALIGICFVIFLGTPWVSMAADKSAALQQLYEAAKKEGQLVLHDGSTIEEITQIIQVFEKRYPGIKVQPIVSPSPVIPQRVIVESQAGKLSIDAIQTSVQSFMVNLIQRNLLRKLDLNRVMDVDPTSVWGEGLLWVLQSIVPCFVYNTNGVSKADVPKTYEDLLDPKFKGGKIYLSGFGMVNATMFFTRKENEVVDYLKKLRAQQIMIQKDPRACATAVSSGEASIGEAFSRLVFPIKQRGAPIDLAPIGPQIYIPDGTSALMGSPHPNAAELWIAWRLSPEGRDTTFKVSGFAPEIKCTNSPSAQYLCDKGIKFRVLSTVEDARLLGEYQEKVRELLGMVPGK
jgi:iron(III) transport system substrate-binding protein